MEAMCDDVPFVASSNVPLVVRSSVPLVVSLSNHEPTCSSFDRLRTSESATADLRRS